MWWWQGSSLWCSQWWAATAAAAACAAAASAAAGGVVGGHGIAWSGACRCSLHLLCILAKPCLPPACSSLAAPHAPPSPPQACILFGLGLVIVTIQLAVQLACTQVETLTIKGTAISDLCISIPTVSGGPARPLPGSPACPPAYVPACLRGSS